MENQLRKTNNNQKGKTMKALLGALVFGIIVSGVGYSQNKTEESCCSEKSKTTMSKICDVPDEVSVSSKEKSDLTASVQSDDKNKKVEKNVNNSDMSTKKEKSKTKSSKDDCCSPDKGKTEKTKTSDKS
jgi:cell division protein FtsN